MRDIIYRGKTKDGEWEYGGVVIYEKDAFIITEEDFEWSIMGDRGDYDGCITPVLPETVGQYTGLTDKNGKKVFEGDIVKNEYRKGQYQYFKIVYDTRVYCWQVENKYGMLGFLYNVIGDLEVIGNIYDDPKLLEVK